MVAFEFVRPINKRSRKIEASYLRFLGDITLRNFCFQNNNVGGYFFVSVGSAVVTFC